MKQAVIIGTSKGRSDWSKECKASCKNSKYPVHVINDNGFELAHISKAYDMGFDEFLYIHDTCIIKDIKLFDMLFEEQRGQSVALSDHPCIFGMYIGKYKREALRGMEMPIVDSKLQAINYEETWTREYVNRPEAHVVLLTPPLHDGSNFVTIRGKQYMKLENDFIIKLKGTWSRNMI